MLPSSQISVDDTQPGKFTVSTSIPWQSHIVSGQNESAVEGSTYAAGTPVELKDYHKESELFKIQPCGQDSAAFWGILLTATAPQKNGAVLLSGVTTVTLTDTVEVGAMVMPDPQHPGKFCVGGDRAQVLAVTTESDKKTAVILLNEAGGGNGAPVALGVITVAPNGLGVAAYKKVKINPAGIPVPEGEDIPIVVPRL